MCREPATGLPLRVLTRAFSKAYQAPRADAGVAMEALPALSPLYVFERRDIDLSDVMAELTDALTLTEAQVPEVEAAITGYLTELDQTQAQPVQPANQESAWVG